MNPARSAGREHESAPEAPPRTVFNAGVIQLVECQLPKLDVAGSSPVARSWRAAAIANHGGCFFARGIACGARAGDVGFFACAFSSRRTIGSYGPR
jgi:hypothetical protein